MAKKEKQKKALVTLERFQPIREPSESSNEVKYMSEWFGLSDANAERWVGNKVTLLYFPSFSSIYIF